MDESMAKIDLHLISWKRPKMTKLVIETIHRNTKRENFRLVVLDNGSEESTVEMLQNMADKGLIDDFIPIKTNLGLEVARNFLLIHATYSDYFVCVDNDCLPPLRDGKDWLEKLYDLMIQNEGYGAIALRTQVMIGTGDIFKEADKNNQDLVDFSHPGGSYRLMDTKAVYSVGGWSRGLLGRGSEEHFIGDQLAQAGYKTAFTAQIRCLHLFGTKDTDRWGYPKEYKPEATGHSDITHPALEQGDDFDTVKYYAGEKNAKAYFKSR